MVLSYLSLTQDSAVLFANPAVFSPAVLEQLEADGVSLRPYESVYSYVGRLTPSQRVMLDTRRINTTLLTSIPSHVSVMDRPNPTALRKAIKNPVEIANMKQAHLADGIALTRFMYWLKTQVGSQPITERSAAAQLEAFRRPAPCTSSPVLTPFWPPVPTAPLSTTPPPRRVTAPSPARAFFWRTPADTTTPGPLTAPGPTPWGPSRNRKKPNYTAVLRGNLALADATFKAGCTGSNLDYAARQPLWELGLDFNHGTGHGVGYLLSVP